MTARQEVMEEATKRRTASRVWQQSQKRSDLSKLTALVLFVIAG